MQATGGDRVTVIDTPVEQAKRRREASWRCEPLPHSGRRDPWHAVPPTTSRGYIEAVEHLDDHGLVAALTDIDALREMYRDGGRRRATAERIVRCWGVVS